MTWISCILEKLTNSYHSVTIEMLVRRWKRRLTGLLLSVWYGIIGILNYLQYRFFMYVSGASEKYIREAFSYLCQLDMHDFYRRDHLYFQGRGLEVHIYKASPLFDGTFSEPTLSKCRLYECVIFQDFTGRIIVHEWRKETRPIDLEFGVTHQTHWHEVFKSGRHVASLDFITHLQAIYGDGKPVLKWDSEGEDRCLIPAR